MSQMIRKECMLFDITAADKKDAIAKMADALDAQGYLTDRELFHEDVWKREEIFPTYIDYEIGLPHGKSDGVKEAGLCIARLAESIKWNEDGDMVNFIVMIAIRKESASDLHLKILSKLSRQLMHEEFRDKIKTGTIDEVYDVLVRALEV